MASTAKPTGNRILDLLPKDESSVLLASTQIVSLAHRQEVYRQDGPMAHVYFPTTSMLGVVIRMEEGKQVEGTTVGNEGMIGLPVLLGLEFHPFSIVSQVPGGAVQSSASSFLQAIKPGGALDQLLRRYILYRLWSANQTGACSTIHSAQERVSRWLLMAHDRAGNDEFTVTHESLSELLGVRRQTVSIIAATLQRAGFISYHRGILRVLDREGLEAASCECYLVLKQLYNRIIGGVDPSAFRHLHVSDAQA
jgi:CRP-like cAMP-binding protein